MSAIVRATKCVQTIVRALVRMLTNGSAARPFSKRGDRATARRWPHRHGSTASGSAACGRRGSSASESSAPMSAGTRGGTRESKREAPGMFQGGRGGTHEHVREGEAVPHGHIEDRSKGGETATAGGPRGARWRVVGFESLRLLRLYHSLSHFLRLCTCSLSLPMTHMRAHASARQGHMRVCALVRVRLRMRVRWASAPPLPAPRRGSSECRLRTADETPRDLERARQ
eukprot:6205215-Pleurochrysis_carterae.AAC.1